jgi:GNAT superfamily N-acetyltransferase
VTALQRARLRAAFDAQIRRAGSASTDDQSAEGAAAASGPIPRIVRSVAADGQGWSGITWSALDESCADAEIADQVSYFAQRGQSFEWKLYDYDQPADLAGRLLAAGFTPDEEETLMVAAVADVPTAAALPDGVRLRPVTGEAGVGLLIDVHEQVFGGDHSRLRRSLLAQLETAPGQLAMVVAMADDQPVCSARIEFLPGTDFASLWGGGTLPAWRRKGIYRALVAYRAGLAAARGYRFLQVDASADSRPVLQHLGFVALARTTPYVWSPVTAA